jgi:hypothetical protein
LLSIALGGSGVAGGLLMKLAVCSGVTLLIFTVGGSGCGSSAPSQGPASLPKGGQPDGGSLGPGGPGTVSDAGGSPHLCADLFDQSVLQTYAIEISADNWAKLDADFHDLTDVLAGTPPQT